MKYSGVEWIGEIPDNWSIRKVKQCFYISKEKAHIENPTILSLARAGVKVRDISNNEGQLAASYNNYNPVIPGDLLLNPMDLYSGANCSLSEVSGVISPAYVNLRKCVELNPKFFDYYFKTQYWAMTMFAHGKGVSFDNRWTMNAESILNYYLPFPSIEEQNKIVEKINEKTAEIDSLIRIENQQIEKLKEYKQAVITEAVTKGLNKNAVMKDSGIERIGKIPESWKTASTKSIFEIIAGATPDTGNIDNWDGNIIWITPADYKTGDVFVNSGRRNLSQLGYDSCSTTLIPPGNIIFSKRAPIGLIAINNKELCTNQGCLSCINKQNISIKYFYYQMSAYTKYYELFGCGTTFKEISAQKFGNFSLVFPPKYAQEDIVKYLDAKCDDIAKLIEIKQQKIELLAKYKKSIIYECVTGKKETS